MGEIYQCLHGAHRNQWAIHEIHEDWWFSLADNQVRFGMFTLILMLKGRYLQPNSWCVCIVIIYWNMACWYVQIQWKAMVIVVAVFSILFSSRTIQIWKCYSIVSLTGRNIPNEVLAYLLQETSCSFASMGCSLVLFKTFTSMSTKGVVWLWNTFSYIVLGNSKLLERDLSLWRTQHIYILHGIYMV